MGLYSFRAVQGSDNTVTVATGLPTKDRHSLGTVYFIDAEIHCIRSRYKIVWQW